jgi:glycosyltransferase involved in cell wall biosynthesis
MSRAGRLMPNDPDVVKVTRLGDYPRHLKHFRHTDCLVSNVPGIAERCRELGWTGALKIISNFPRDVIPVAVDRALLDTPKDAFLVSSAGRFVGRKGFDTLVWAVAQIPNAWLWLMGDGDKRAELEALAAEVGIRDRTRFTGWVEEPMHYVAASDVFVMPSRHEPLGNVVLESWHAGVPTVSTRSEGPTWFVDDGVDALMCGIGDVEGMAAAIVRIQSDPGLARRLVANGRAKLAARFSKERVLDQYLAVFDGRY